MTDEMPYEVTGTAGEVEFRRYPAMVLATVEENGDDRGFRRLYAFITGHNRGRRDLPMTAPVVSSVEIPMTAPVISSVQVPMTTPVISGPGTMSFVMPAGLSRAGVPEPSDPAVRIEEVPAREVAVVRFSGRAHEKDVEDATARLVTALAKAGVKTRGRPFLMRYNAPLTPGFLRRNEVGVEVER